MVLWYNDRNGRTRAQSYRTSTFHLASNIIKYTSVINTTRRKIWTSFVAPPEGFVMDFKMADGGGVGWGG
jgi:hypothetical protein